MKIILKGNHSIFAQKKRFVFVFVFSAKKCLLMREDKLERENKLTENN
jgi:hypothetical protein